MRERKALRYVEGGGYCHYKLYKKGVKEFCEYMEIPRIQDSFCDRSIFFEDQHMWHKDFAVDVAYTTSIHLRFFIGSLGLGLRIENESKLIKSLESRVVGWFLSGGMSDIRIHLVCL